MHEWNKLRFHFVVHQFCRYAFLPTVTRSVLRRFLAEQAGTVCVVTAAEHRGIPPDVCIPV